MVDIFLLLFLPHFFPEVWSASMNLRLQRCFTAHAYSRPGAICSNRAQKLSVSVRPERQGLLVQALPLGYAARSDGIHETLVEPTSLECRWSKLVPFKRHSFKTPCETLRPLYSLQKTDGV